MFGYTPAWSKFGVNLIVKVPPPPDVRLANGGKLITSTVMSSPSESVTKNETTRIAPSSITRSFICEITGGLLEFSAGSLTAEVVYIKSPLLRLLLLAALPAVLNSTVPVETLGAIQSNIKSTPSGVPALVPALLCSI